MIKIGTCADQSTHAFHKCFLHKNLKICAMKFSIYDIGTNDSVHMEIMVTF